MASPVVQGMQTNMFRENKIGMNKIVAAYNLSKIEVMMATSTEQGMQTKMFNRLKLAVK